MHLRSMLVIIIVDAYQETCDKNVNLSFVSIQGSHNSFLFFHILWKFFGNILWEISLVVLRIYSVIVILVLKI
jgi:hypothetical protein